MTRHGRWKHGNYMGGSWAPMQKIGRPPGSCSAAVSLTTSGRPVVGGARFDNYLV